MKYWMICAALLLGACSGCAAMEDLIFGPEPEPWAAPAGGCAYNNAQVQFQQTAEPDLLRR
jgi:hypothetical protein